jgi:murein DD-endopeptidase MepM/ murein hydrolase activator NlpD
MLTAGDTIGSVGATGRVDRPQLHFEIRKSRQPIDPRSLIL